MYFLNGTGFGITRFDADKVVPIEGEPPTKLVEGTVILDGGFEYKGITDLNHKWNGWACPWILAEDIERFIGDTNPHTEEYGVGNLFELKDGVLKITDIEYPGEHDMDEPMVNILGKDCYYLGNIGWCFDFEQDNM